MSIDHAESATDELARRIADLSANDPQFAAAGTPVAIDGRPGRLAGRVSMDMLTVDLTDHPQAGVGSRVELWGGQVPAVDVVAHSQTSTYRLLSAVKRVPLLHRG